MLILDLLEAWNEERSVRWRTKCFRIMMNRHEELGQRVVDDMTVGQPSCNSRKRRRKMKVNREAGATMSL